MPELHLSDCQVQSSGDMGNNFIDEVISLYKNNEWEKILEIKDSSENELSKKLLWVWPSKSNLKFIQRTVSEFELKGVTSIGCGTGLFEWLLHQATDVAVEGYEVNKEWWTSKYCSPQFITLRYPELPLRKGQLRNDYALLFCYFNNGPAFDDYINVFGGKLVFIVGPGPGRGTHTNPEPFKPHFKTNWILHNFEEVRDTKDFITAYVRES